MQDRPGRRSLLCFGRWTGTDRGFSHGMSSRLGSCHWATDSLMWNCRYCVPSCVCVCSTSCVIACFCLLLRFVSFRLQHPPCYLLPISSSVLVVLTRCIVDCLRPQTLMKRFDKSGKNRISYGAFVTQLLAAARTITPKRASLSPATIASEIDTLASSLCARIRRAIAPRTLSSVSDTLTAVRARSRYVCSLGTVTLADGCILYPLLFICGKQ